MFRFALFFVLFSTALSAGEIKVLAFSGSTREGSLNKLLVTEAANAARQSGASVNIINLKDYPLAFYDEDLEAKQGMPLKAKELRQLMVQSQVILIASPEYNGSLSAVLKNTLDWASRGENGGGSRDAFKDKKFIIMSTSPGAAGGARGLKHLRQIIEDVGGTVVVQQIVVPDAYNAFDGQGHLKDPKLKQELQQLVQSVVK